MLLSLPFLPASLCAQVTPLPPVPPLAEHNLKLTDGPQGTKVYQGNWKGLADEGPGLQISIPAPETSYNAEALSLALSGPTELIEVTARPAAAISPGTWSAGAVVLPSAAKSDMPNGILIPRSRFAPTPGTGATGTLPAEALTLDIRLARRDAGISHSVQLTVGAVPGKWSSLDNSPREDPDGTLRVRVRNQTPETTARVALGRWIELSLQVETVSGQALPGGILWIEGPDRDQIEYDDRVEVRHGEARMKIWARSPGIARFHLLDPVRRRQALLTLEAVREPADYHLRVEPQGFLGRYWISSGPAVPVTLESTAPAGHPQLQAVHLAVRDGLGQPVFARWFSTGDFVAGEARITVPGMGLYTLEATGTTASADLVSSLSPEVSLLPETRPVGGTDNSWPIAMTAQPDGVTTRSHMGLLLTLEDIPLTAPIAARDRLSLIVNQRSPSENSLYPFPIGIDGAGQLQDTRVDRARSLAAAHRRLGTFWSAEELDFAVNVPAPGMRLWYVADRFWALRRAEYGKVAIVLSGIAAWESNWPTASDQALAEWRSWLQTLIPRFRQASTWVIGRDGNRPGMTANGTRRPLLDHFEAARLTKNSLEALSATRIPFRLAFGTTDGFRPRYLDQVLSQLDPATTGLQTLAYRMRAVAPHLSPSQNQFDTVASQTRNLLRNRGFSTREAWWIPVGFSSHPAGLSRDGQATAVTQTFVLGIANRISKMFWNRIADDEGFHPEDPERRSGLLDHRLRPKPALATFLINTYLLARLDPVRSITEPGLTIEAPHTTGTVPVQAHHFRINQHSVKREGGLTVVWADPPNQAPGTAEAPPVPHPMASGFPPTSWPLEPDTPTMAIFAYRSTTGGPVFALNQYGAVVEPLKQSKTGQTPLGPTGLYHFPVSASPLFIWDSGLNWGLGHPQPD